LWMYVLDENTECHRREWLMDLILATHFIGFVAPKMDSFDSCIFQQRF
jgi:hypothetical protein